MQINVSIDFPSLNRPARPLVIAIGINSVQFAVPMAEHISQHAMRVVRTTQLLMAKYHR
jgi:hypothetical protein